ncbi:unnamed protein product [Closterium sp. Naga37s-1]|nr:unnamed protein product [Closterium sp. Naga37s-1]
MTLDSLHMLTLICAPQTNISYPLSANQAPPLLLTPCNQEHVTLHGSGTRAVPSDRPTRAASASRALHFPARSHRCLAFLRFPLVPRYPRARAYCAAALSLRQLSRGAAAAARMAHVTYLSAEEFERLAADRSKRVAVVDVRDEERQMDGHIHGSVHAPSETFRDHLPHLATRLSNHDAVVFHCALSQVRGPKCANIYVSHHQEQQQQQQQQQGGSSGSDSGAAQKKQQQGGCCMGVCVGSKQQGQEEERVQQKRQAPKVHVLRYGFNGWMSSGRPFCTCSEPICCEAR